MLLMWTKKLRIGGTILQHLKARERFWLLMVHSDGRIIGRVTEVLQWGESTAISNAHVLVGGCAGLSSRGVSFGDRGSTARPKLHIIRTSPYRTALFCQVNELLAGPFLT